IQFTYARQYTHHPILYSLTASIKAAAFSSGIFGKIPWPKFTIYRSFPNSSIICFTIFFISEGGLNNRVGSKFPCNVIFPPVKYLAFLGEQVQSTPKAEAPLFAIVSKANQQPFPKAITWVSSFKASIICCIYFQLNS